MLKEEEHAESQLSPAISEVSGWQQCNEPPYIGVLLRNGHQTSSRNPCYAQNRRSCPDSWLMEQVPDNMVLPLVPNASVSKGFIVRRLGVWMMKQTGREEFDLIDKT